MLDVSSQLAAAQNRLIELRAAAQAARLAAPSPAPSPAPQTAVSPPAPALSSAPDTAVSPPAPAPQTAVSWLMRNALADLERRRAAAVGIITHRQPAPGLEWLRTAAGEIMEQQAETAVSAPCTVIDEAVTGASDPRGATPETGPVTASSATVRVWPVMGAALAKAGRAPHHRLYAACVSIDPDGRRAFDPDDLRAAFTDESNGRYLFTWRRMRQILAQGDGQLWDVDERTRRVYLRSIAKIAASLGLVGIGRGVELPVNFIFAGQGVFNAHLHAAWLSANGDETKPISRAAIASATAVPERTQRHYNRIAGVVKQENIEVGVKHTDVTEEETAWSHGRASFEFVDYDGRQGQPGGVYRARRLPNGYERRHQLAANGRRRKINRQLHGLVNHEERGCQCKRPDKRYYSSGLEAAKAANRRRGSTVYWPENGRKRAGAALIWHGVLS